YALYGSDTYRSRKKLNEIIEAYRQKAGADIDFHRFNAQEHDCANLKGIMATSSLFAQKKLVVVEYAFGDSMESMLTHAKQWQDAKDQHLILCHETLDASAKKYLKLWTPLLTQSQEFGEMKGSTREAWICQEAALRGVILSPTDAHRITAITSDSWSAVQEIEKIAVGGRASGEHSFGFGKNPTVFDLGDAFFTDKKQALVLLHRMLANGEDEFGLFSYISNRARTLVAIKQCAIEKRQVPPWLGIHPFVAKKTAELVRVLTPVQCASFASRFFEEDFRIKIGLSQPRDSLVRMLVEGGV
ncbi:MAG: hypothetical protein AAB975_05075, partial [Patescibacteria group bacterium]